MEKYANIILRKCSIKGIIYRWACLKLIRVCNFLYSLFMSPLKIDDVHNILLVNFNQIGDAILLTPTINEVSKIFHGADILILTTPAGKTALEGCPNVKEIMVFDAKTTNQIKFIHKLRMKKQDLVIDFQLTFFSARMLLVSYLSGAKYRVAFKREGFSNFLPTHEFQFPLYKHMAECYFEMVSSINPNKISSERKYHVPIKFSDSQWAEQVLSKENSGERSLLIAIHPCTKNKLHLWTGKGFAEVANYLVDKHNARIVFTGMEDEKEIIDEIIPKLKKLPIIIAQNDFGKFCAVIKQVNLLISVDTSAVHIAVATHTPVIAIYGPTVREYWAPLNNPLQRIVRIHNPACAGRCRIIEMNRIIPTLEFCTEDDAICITRINSSDVINAVEEMLGNINKCT